MDTNLTDKVVLITGASGGIGQATARAFAAEGAKLALHYHQNEESAERLRDELNVQSAILQADLRDETVVESMFAQVIGALGRVDALIVNAGIWTPEAVPLHAMPLEQWQETIETDLTSAFLCCRAFLRHLAEQPRQSVSITFVGSTAGIFGEADHADYSAAKAAMVYGLTLSLKNEIIRLCPRGRVNAVCPGWVDTPMARAGGMDGERMNRVFATMPLRKIATAEDVAAAIVFLTSDATAGHLSGTILPIAGGMEGRMLHG